MNILQIVPELNVGGVERGTVDLACGLIQRGHRAIVISGGGSLVNELKHCGATHYTLPVHKKSPFAIWRSIPRVIKLLKDEKIDIIHARSRVPAIIGFISARKTQLPFITTCHGYYSRHPLSYVMGWGKFVIVPSNAIGRHMMDDFGVCPDRIRLIPRGVSLEKYPFRSIDEPKKDNFFIGMIGRITPIKGHDIFLKAACKVIRLLPNTKVIVVGDPPKGKENYLKELNVLTRRLGIADSVEFLSTTYHIREILEKIDLLVMPSISAEGFGRVIIEAGACGVPVVATKVGGIVDIVDDGRTGCLVPPQDVMALSNAMLNLLRDRKFARRVGLAARERVEKEFTLDAMVDNTIKVYEEAKRSSRILVIKMSALGDVILASPSLRSIDKNLPFAHICVLVGIKSCHIIQRSPYVDNVIVYDKDGKDKGIIGFLNLAKELWNGRFDMVIDLQNNRQSHILSFLSGASIRYGYNNGKLSELLNYRLKDIPLPPIEHQFRLLRFAGINPDSEQLELFITAEDERNIEKLLEDEWVRKEQPLIGINLGGSLHWKTKRWGLKKFASVCDVLAGTMHLRSIVIGSIDEIEEGNEFLRLTNSHPIMAIGKTSVMELAALIKHCKAFISLDTATMHIAAAVGTPFVALFGPTDPQRHLPPNGRCIVIRKDLRCSPCYKRMCRHMRCMEEIGTEEVVEAVRRLIVDN